MVTLVNDVCANVVRFSREEAIGRRYEEKLKILRRLYPGRAKRREERLQRLAWCATEREIGHRCDCIGKEVP